MKTICIYHGNCQDGFTSAWVVHREWPDAEFFPATHGNPPPEVAGKDVFMVDFCYPREIMEQLVEQCHTMIVLDHHATAQAALKGLRADNLYVVFDMERSGAGITWDHFNNPFERPQLLNHVEDRDLWRFSLDGTREIVAALFSYPYDFGAYDALMELDPMETLFPEGEAITRRHLKDVNELLGVVTRDMLIAGEVVPMANLPYTMASDAGHILCEGKPFAGVYYDKPEEREFSLRSRPEGADVGKIAASYGGGGHKHASGFRIPFSQLEQFNVG